MKALLWFLLGVSALLFWWVGKVFISQPRFNHPRLFWNPAVAKILTTAPLLGLGAVAIGGFIFTTSGWWYLGAVLAVFFFLSSKPASF
jgi:hypothetical protein